jgi:hypothetical protein
MIGLHAFIHHIQPSRDSFEPGRDSVEPSRDSVVNYIELCTHPIETRTDKRDSCDHVIKDGTYIFKESRNLVALVCLARH